MWVLGEDSTLSAGPRAFPRGYVVREEVGPVQQDGAELKRAGSECFCPWFPKGDAPVRGFRGEVAERRRLQSKSQTGSEEREKGSCSSFYLN